MNRIVIMALAMVALGLSSFAASQPPPDTVKVGVYVISVHDIDFHDKEYTIRFWLWFVYKPQVPNPDDPIQFNFEDQIDIPNAKEIEISESIADTVRGKVWMQLKLRCVMKENWRVENFPFDEQKLRVVVENTIFDQSRLIFVADKDDSKFDNVESLDTWTVDNFEVTTNVSLYSTGFGDPQPDRRASIYSTFIFGMDIKREAAGLFAKIFIGMYIAFLISGLSFLSDPSELEPRFGLPVGGLFAAVGNKYIIDSLLPESSSFSLVDTLHTLTFFGIFCILAVSAIALKLDNFGKKEAANRINKIGAILVVAFYILANLYFVLRA